MTTIKKTRRFTWRLMAGFATVLALAVCSAAQTVVVGTGDPDTDVKAVQAAVDQGGEVILRGHFSFKRPPTVPTALAGAGYPPATVLVSKAVAISGVGGQEDEMTTIEGGTIPFYVEAPGSSVTIHALRFVRPMVEAVLVYAASGLAIVSCKVEGIEPLPNFGSIGIDIDTNGNPPSPTQPGKPENISGTILIADNDIDVVGGSALDNTLGITVFSVGQSPDKEADIYISGNKITNTTEPAINFRRLGGRAHVEGNVINTGPVSSQQAPRPEAIRVVNTGSYVIAHNKIDCQWPDPQAISIGVFSQFAQWPIERAVVIDNEVTMSPPAGTVFGDLSAGIEIRGFADSNLVANNRVGGRAKAALSVDVFKGGTPTNNALVLNRFDDFAASVGDIFVGLGVMNTRILGRGTVYDQGTGTVIEPVPF